MENSVSKLVTIPAGELTTEAVYRELREFRHDTNNKFQAVQLHMNSLEQLTTMHVKECNARKNDIDELLKEARDQKTWREMNSLKFSKVKGFLVGAAAILTSLSTIGAACVYLWSKFYG